MKIWERYIIFGVIKTLLFILISLYLTFVLIDFSTNGNHYFKYTPPSYPELALYYLYYFARHLDLFLPLALLLATIKTLSGMNARNEITALKSSGMNTLLLCRPLFLIALFMASVSFINLEYVTPHSLAFIEEFQIIHSKNPDKQREKQIQMYSLPNQTKLVFQSWDNEKKTLFDVFWILSPNEFYHAKYLSMSFPSVGKFVDHFKRNDHLLEKTESFSELIFEQMPPLHFTEKTLIAPPEHLSLSQLLSQIVEHRFLSNEEEAALKTSLHRKLSAPLLSFLVLLGALPYCFRFSRYSSSFMLYTLSLFVFIVFYTMLDAAEILAENQVLYPSLLIWTPFVIALGFSSYRFFEVAKK
ncbi:MAG TPA: LptF/LptG family permease [Chlamydiales bacterium]|nr:LptF/LptG family permease [Chlamydiales bacterium]